ncbi:MAG: hypothetical protein DWB56_06735 [Candidatus Jettenia sp.]|uniref:Phage protein n=1 Tax=Candidatus Jettenia caeni TaxID=247490 RepID=I3IN06_9BACT|nr:hypothetical protein [Candidatus Jettenia sp. AMX1]MBC6928649.1 hypothetical protein [Candidatus Jettenia sp.]GAB63101.1 hypothetical protein KSU1_C1505 [Candidatus Jettenia caeni]KAA0250627.1 MAG: hypothetical protein EDM77_03675 [Candidatus Jettenia sp. AMX1]MCE7879961.1 hypothetical protein [Candidatus Jettenia sp. AMX1]MCQ3926743.1 hypothetical protein [Candidatus Jettenia sp.]
MLNINVTIQGDTVIIDGLQRFAKNSPAAIRRGLERVAAGVYDDAYKWLSGPGGIYEERVSKKTGKKRRKKIADYLPGQYPVPVRTGHLRRLLNWLNPGRSKTYAGVGTFSAGPLEVVIYNAAEYAEPVFRGTGSSAKYGPRDALKDGFERFNRGSRIQGILEEEIGKEIRSSGFTA